MCSGIKKRRSNLVFLQQSELDDALAAVVKYAQVCFLRELVEGLTKGEEIKHKSLSQRRIHPILIPKKSYLAKLIVRHWHLYDRHASLRLLTVIVSRRFWIVNIRFVVHRVMRRCTVCVRVATVNPQPQMADLHLCRIQEAHPFSVVGVDR